MAKQSTSPLAPLNDAFRARLGLGGPIPGQTVMTAGVAGLDAAAQARLFGAVARFASFTPDNDPYGEHDCAVVTVDGERFIWKIDYYADSSCTYGADDPVATCYRVLTIMFASEY